MTTKIADDTSSIAQRLKEIEAQKMQAIMGTPLDDAKPVDAPADIDWTGMYGVYVSPSGFNNAVREFMMYKAAPNTSGMSLSSLAHPEWPYTGTGHEWRVRIKS